MRHASHFSCRATESCSLKPSITKWVSSTRGRSRCSLGILCDMGHVRGLPVRGCLSLSLQECLVHQSLGLAMMPRSAGSATIGLAPNWCETQLDLGVGLHDHILAKMDDDVTFQTLFQLFGAVYVSLELGPFFAVKTEPLTDEKSRHGGADSITIVHTGRSSCFLMSLANSPADS